MKRIYSLRETEVREGNRRFSWISKGIQAQGRTEYLSENYRNAAEIYRLSTRFSGPSAFGEIEGDPYMAGDVRSRCPAGAGNIFVVREEDRTAEITKVVALVSQLLAGKREPDTRINTKFHFADIGIVYPTHKRQEALISKMLLPRIRTECDAPVVWVSDPNGVNRSNSDPAIRVQTIHHAKGLQYRAVIFMWADLLPFAQGRDLEQDRKLFYVAVTRAAQLLAIVHSGQSLFVDDIYRAIGERATIG
jgi:superfamily I DNA/RNA helicase